jgi:hypothetical protein
MTLSRLWKAMLALGILLVLAGFLYDVAFAGIPFQDPTPAMQAGWEADRATAAALMTAGFLAGGAGLVLGVALRLVGRR